MHIDAEDAAKLVAALLAGSITVVGIGCSMIMQTAIVTSAIVAANHHFGGQKTMVTIAEKSQKNIGDGKINTIIDTNDKKYVLTDAFLYWNRNSEFKYNQMDEGATYTCRVHKYEKGGKSYPNLSRCSQTGRAPVKTAKFAAPGL